MIRLTDDGTLDTVLECSECLAEMRYNYGATMEGIVEEDRLSYPHWIDQLIEDETQEHECSFILGWWKV